MAFDYDPIAATASRLIAQFGQVCQVRSVTGAAHNPVTGVISGGSTVNTNVNGALVAFSKANTPGDALIQVGDKLAVLDGAIAVGDELVHDSHAWECVQVWPVKPGDTHIVWRAQVRGGSGVVTGNAYLLLETGDYLLLESGDKLLLEA